MSTGKLSNVNNPPRMRSALLDGMVLRMAEGMQCRCGHLVQNYPKALGWPGSFALICDACHQDVICYEPQL